MDNNNMFIKNLIKKIGYSVINNLVDNKTSNMENDVKEIILNEIPDNITIDLHSLKNKFKNSKEKIEIVDCKNKNWDN